MTKEQQTVIWGKLWLRWSRTLEQHRLTWPDWLWENYGLTWA